MSKFTEEDIPISCGVCSVMVQGISSMEKHITSTHPDYTPTQATHYAACWMRDSFEQVEQEAIDYAYSQREKYRIS